MKDATFTYWQDGEHWIGHLDEFPDYLTQGTSLDDLKAHLADLHADLTSGVISHVRRHAKLQVA
jgi:predicted RNase H-like HicB family nuclease